MAKANKSDAPKTVRRRTNEELIAEAEARLAKLKAKDFEKDRRRHEVLSGQRTKVAERAAKANSQLEEIDAELAEINERLESAPAVTDGVGEV